VTEQLVRRGCAVPADHWRGASPVGCQNSITPVYQGRLDGPLAGCRAGERTIPTVGAMSMGALRATLPSGRPGRPSARLIPPGPTLPERPGPHHRPRSPGQRGMHDSSADGAGGALRPPCRRSGPWQARPVVPKGSVDRGAAHSARRLISDAAASAIGRARLFRASRSMGPGRGGRSTPRARPRL